MVVTLRDVARAAGVSPATASRALAAPDRVAPARREAVERAAHELGYQPNRAARELATGRTGQLCLLVPDLANPFFAAVAKAVQSRARTAGYAVLVTDSEEDARLEAEIVTQLAPRVDGVIVCSPRADEATLAHLAPGVPLVLVNRTSEHRPAVVVDDADGVRQAVEHLLALGHQRIAYVGGPASSWSDARRRGALADLAAQHRLDLVDLGHVPPVFTGGVATADRVLASGATAALAFNDLVALGLMDRLRTRDAQVPGQLSVVGFDDTSAATLVSPALTTVGLPLAALGRTAVDLLLDVVDAPELADAEPEVTVLPVALVVRGTTGPVGATPAVALHPVEQDS
ncbi:LacI family DNA-binding transcriptional regulator [Cellulomonas hominis]